MDAKYLEMVMEIQQEGATIQEIIASCEELIEDYANVTGDSNADLNAALINLRNARRLIDEEDKRIEGDE